MKFNVGDEGPEGNAMEPARDAGNERVIELDRGVMDVFREDDSEEGRVGALGGCCRIRRKPEAPSPCSCSVMTGDLDIVSYSAAANPASKENRIRAFSVPACAKFGVLLFLGIASCVGAGDGLRRPRSLEPRGFSTP